jgi:hypothetical protein
VTATLFIVLLVAGVFLSELLRRWWRENEWKRRWRQKPDD